MKEPEPSTLKGCLMPDEDAGSVDDANQAESRDSRRRVNALLGTILEDETLSDEARSVLRHLQETPEDLVDIDADALGSILLEGLS